MISAAGRAGAESGAALASSGSSDRELERILEAWQSLPEAVRAGILAMVMATRSE